MSIFNDDGDCPDCRKLEDEFNAWKQGKKGIEEYYEIKEQLAGYKAQVAGQAKYIECLLDEIKQLKETK